MSLVSLLTLALYSYVLQLCQKEARHNARLRREGQLTVPVEASSRIRLALIAFAFDLLISAYFSTVTPILLKQGGLAFNRKTMPRPLFWFFAITGFVPTASMTVTVLCGKHWSERIRQKRAWRIFHGLTALVAYFSWWLACSPVFIIAVVGERRTLSILQKFSKPD